MPNILRAVLSFDMFVLSDVAPEFREQLQSLIPKLLHPDRLAEKEINGNKVTCRGLLEFFKVTSAPSEFFLLNLNQFFMSNIIIIVLPGLHQDLPGRRLATAKDYAHGMCRINTS